MIGSLENAPSHALEEPESTQGQSLLKQCMAVSAMLRVIWEYKNVTQKPAQVNAHILRPIIQYLYDIMYSINVSCWNNLWWKLFFSSYPLWMGWMGYRSLLSRMRCRNQNQYQSQTCWRTEWRNLYWPTRRNRRVYGRRMSRLDIYLSVWYRKITVSIQYQ